MGASAPPPGRFWHHRLNLQHNRYSSWTGMGVASAESLIRCGGFDMEDWHQSCLLAWNPEDASAEAELTPVAALMAILPLVLFYHEEDLIWQKHLWQASSLLSPGGDWKWGLWAFGYGITQSLQAKLDPNRAMAGADLRFANIQKMAKIVSCPPGGQDETSSVEAAKLANLLAKNATWEMAVAELTALRGKPPAAPIFNVAVALALYCFLSTPEDFGLSVVRAVRTGSDSELTGAIAGALGGAYNGIAGIPLSWQISAPKTHQTHPDSSISITPLSLSPIPPPVVETSPAVELLLPLASRIFAAWAGIYDLNRQNIDSAHWSFVTSNLSLGTTDKVRAKHSANNP